MNIIEALGDPNLFGGLPAFRDLSTWGPWIAFLKALYGLPLSPLELALFRKYTGRGVYAPPPGGWREAACIVGRQSGKSRIAALIASYEAAMAAAEPDRTETYSVLVAQDIRGSMRTLLRYARAPFEMVGVLKQCVISGTAETLSLTNGVVLAAYPCRPASVRGIRARVVVLDELAFYVSGEGNPVDTEMLRACRPCCATTGGKVVAISSPYGQAGALWDLHQAHFGRDDSPVLAWEAQAPQMNATLSPDYLERMKETDPEGYRAEVLGEFRAGLSTLLDPAALEACVVQGRRELPPDPRAYHVAFVDPSGGRSDAFTLAIGHRPEDRIVVDALRSWEPPFNPDDVVAEASGLLRTYHVHWVSGDRYAGEWPATAFARHGITYTTCEIPKSLLYLELVPLVNAGLVELPDHAVLLAQFRRLQRMRGPSGRDHVDHPRGGHDDVANAVAGLASLLPVSAGLRRPDPDADLRNADGSLNLPALYRKQFNDHVAGMLRDVGAGPAAAGLRPGRRGRERVTWSRKRCDLFLGADRVGGHGRLRVRRVTRGLHGLAAASTPA